MNQASAHEEVADGSADGGMAGSRPGVAVIDGRFEIDLSARRPDLDSPNAEAFAASDLESERRQCFALVCRADVPSRVGDAGRIEMIASANLVKLFAWGAVSVPGGGRRMTFVLQNPLGQRAMVGKGDGAPLEETFILEAILPGILNALDALHGKAFAHRAVRPSNIFMTDNGRRSAILGECLTAPPGFDQPISFEPIERAMASPEGRGAGTPACDMYALGMTLAALLLGRISQPADASRQTLERIERGSAKVFARGLHCSDAMRELLEGLLVDDAKQRWGVSDVRSWLGGRRPSPPGARRSRDGMRPFAVSDHDHKSPRALAFAFTGNTEAAQAALRLGRLAGWLRQSYGDREMSEAVNTLLGRSEDIAAGRVKIDEEVVASVSLILDPPGPIRYRNQAIMLDGFGHALAFAMLNDAAESLQTIKRMLSIGLPLRAIAGDRDVGRRQQREGMFRALVGFAKDAAPETGIERCLYELNPQLHCLSPLVAAAHAATLDALIKALDAAARGGEPPRQRPRDRHVAAFIACHLPIVERQKVVVKLHGAGASRDEGLHDLAVLAVIQRYCDSGPLSGLARWLARGLGESVDAFYARSRRGKVKAGLERAVRTGNLNTVLKVASDRRERALDRREYRIALARQSALRAEVVRLKDALTRCNSIALVRGRQLAFSISVIILLVACASAATGVWT